jgi:hypothetical protein
LPLMPVGRRSSIGESKVRAGQGEDGGNQAMSDTPITDAAYLRAGRRVDDQIAELDKTCRRLEEELNEARRMAEQWKESATCGDPKRQGQPFPWEPQHTQDQP